MSVRQDTQTRYCSTADVARYLRGFPALEDTDDFLQEGDAAYEPSDPSISEVESFIQKWTSKFDRKTGQSFRANQILDETHDHNRLYYWLSGHPINVIKRNIITPLDSSKGDKLEVWTGNKWEDWVAKDTRTEGREGDYWVDDAVGIIFIYERAILRPHPKFRVSYRYGGEDSDGDDIADYLPSDVRDAVAAGAASDILRTDVYGTGVPGNSDDGPSPKEMADDYAEQFHDTVSDYKKLHFV
jgi:hypothetical protein